MFIPHNLVITPDIISNSNIGRSIIEKREIWGEGLVTYFGLTAFIMMVKKKIVSTPNKRVQFSEYIDLLPLSSREFPVLFNNKELEYLNGSHL